MKKTLSLKAEHLAELTTEELGGVVGASGITCTDLPPTVDVNRCPTLLC